ncbi:HAD family hydrolase [Kitasatospora sp. NPDC048194]|uniref:HAD family hydrolase n=1 Tax=Kitasatospora sp. NPDC048194 TaxID=3364045 RepID=UPI003712E412
MTALALFDLDGTLLDTASTVVDTAAATLTALGVHGTTPRAIRATIGRPLAEAFAHLLDAPADSRAVTAAVRGYLALYREQVVPRAPALLYPGVARGLARLRSHGLTLAVATNMLTASAETLLTAAGVREHFALVVGADAVARPKPAPDAGLLITTGLGHRPADAVMVGDTVNDLHMATAAGMPSIAVTYGHHGASRLRAAAPTWLAPTFPAAVARILAPTG